MVQFLPPRREYIQQVADINKTAFESARNITLSCNQLYWPMYWKEGENNHVIDKLAGCT
jgi:hypothetical protein